MKTGHQLAAVARILFGIVALAGIFIVSQYNFLLFHNLVEISAVIVACSIFLLFWNSRRFFRNGFFLFIGIGCLFAGILDLLHALTYKGMAVFPGMSGDESLQLKTAGRWIASSSFLLAPLFLRRRINLAATFLAYSAILAAVLYLVFSHRLPDYYVTGAGMTNVEHFCRGLSCLAFLAAGVLLSVRRRDLDPQVLQLVLASLLTSTVSELASALSVEYYGLLKVGARLAELASLYLLYKAFIEVGLTRPYDILFQDLKHAEAAMRQARRRADAANAAKSEFLANMSHEIRTPMTAILGFAELIGNSMEGGTSCLNHATCAIRGAHQEHTRIIRRNGEYLLRLINDILDISKIEAGKMELERVVCSPVQLVEEVVSLMGVRAAEKGLSLQTRYEFPLPETIQSDPARVRQVLVNLVGNAVKFTSQGRVESRCAAGRTARRGK